MDLFCRPRKKWIGTGVVTTLLVLSATAACTFVQNSREPASPKAPVVSDAELASRVKAAGGRKVIDTMSIMKTSAH